VAVPRGKRAADRQGRDRSRCSVVGGDRDDDENENERCGGFHDQHLPRAHRSARRGGAEFGDGPRPTPYAAHRTAAPRTDRRLGRATWLQVVMFGARMAP
jgi:hypothetical protein